MIKYRIPHVLMLAMLLVVAATSVDAQVPPVINYQGRLTDNQGDPVPDGTYDLTLTIYTAAVGGDEVWGCRDIPVSVADGLFSLLLGEACQLPHDMFAKDTSLWLGIVLNGGDEGVPRTRLASMPFAYHALRADTAEYVSSGSSGGWVDDGDVVRLATSDDKVGIGTSTASERLVVGNDIGYYGAKYIVSGSPWLDDVCGVKMGYNADWHTTIQWDGDDAPFKIHTRQGGVEYFNTLTAGSGNVGIGLSFAQEPLTIGVNLGSYYGDFVQIGRLGSGSYAGFMCGEDENNHGTMLWYNNSNQLRLGSTDNGEDYDATMIIKGGKVGIGAAPVDSSTLYIDHVDNTLTSMERTSGILSKASSSSEIGIVEAGSFYATGSGFVRGISAEAYKDGGGIGGLFSSSWIGIYADGDFTAADLHGDVAVYGNLTKTSGSFRIDHPLDPENKYLQHSFVESPDMMNIYNGNVTTDTNGNAEVILPGYFDPLNKDFRYQLTVIGTFAQAIISEEIQNGMFEIKTDKPNVKVSWMVTGIRQDKWANEHRIQVEVDKPDDERGHYIAPELYGFGEEKEINYQPHGSSNIDRSSD
ncbi:MAG: hypothetical protein ABIK83_08090 [Candidatus Zixiibacteriota bacterium]